MKKTTVVAARARRSATSPMSLVPLVRRDLAVAAVLLARAARVLGLLGLELVRAALVAGRLRGLLGLGLLALDGVREALSLRLVHGSPPRLLARSGLGHLPVQRSLGAVGHEAARPGLRLG